MENFEKCTVAMLGGPCSQHDTGNTSWLNQPQSAIMPDGTKPLPEPMLTYHRWGSLAFINLRALSLDDVKKPINKTRLKIVVLKWHLGLPGANELTLKALPKLQIRQLQHVCRSGTHRLHALIELTHWPLGDFRWANFTLMLSMYGWDISLEIAHRCLSQDFTDDKSTLVQVMAWCR